jgi:hypothetical protein
MVSPMMKNILLRLCVCSALLPYLAACHCDLMVAGKCRDKRRESDPPLTASWTLIDAETGKPIKDAWINFVWSGKGDKNGRTHCTRSVIAQTDENGRYSNTAKDGSWRIDMAPVRFVPGYEVLNYRWGIPDKNHVTSFVAVQPTERGKYPAWFRKLEAMGYHYNDTTGTTTYYEKALPNIGMREINSPPYADGGRTEFWVTHRSLPELTISPGIGFVCNEPGGENIGLNDPATKMIDYQRGLQSYRYICDAQWDSVPQDYASTSAYSLIYQAIWISPRGNEEENEFLRLFPEFAKSMERSNYSRALTKTEREKFCAWLEPYSHQLEQ